MWHTNKDHDPHNILGGVCFGTGARRAGGAGILVWMRSKKAVAEATQPLADTLARTRGQMREFEAQRHALGGIDAHLSALSKDTVALSQALRGPNSRGRWGELTLQRVAELAGMAPYCDFYEQVSGEGRRPDMIGEASGWPCLASGCEGSVVGVPGRGSCDRCCG